MKKIILWGIIGLAFTGDSIGYGQSTTQWASQLVDFSSQLSPVQYAAMQVLGEPNVLPAGGKNPRAWMPLKEHRPQYLHVGFDSMIQVSQIAIAESYNPGVISKVYLYDEKDQEHLVFSFDDYQQAPLSVSFMRNIFIEKTQYKVKSLKLLFAAISTGNSYGIDAVAVTDFSLPLEAQVPVPEQIREGIEVSALGKEINSHQNEVCPLFSADGKIMYFGRQYHPGNVGGEEDPEDIWYAVLQEDGTWSEAKNLKEVNTKYPDFFNSVSMVNGSLTFLLGNKLDAKGRPLAGVSKVVCDSGKWSTPKNMDIEDYYNYNDYANYFLGESNVLLMSLERMDSQGERDLYVSFEQTDGTFTPPLNLGPTINTTSDEGSPFLLKDKTTLFFSSSGFSGYGKNDIYVSHRQDDSWTNWSAPENLGPDINTPNDDLYLTIPANSDYAYISREVTEGNIDLYRVKFPLFDDQITVKGRVTYASRPTWAKVIFYQDNQPMDEIQTDSVTGQYQINLDKGHIYTYQAHRGDLRSAVKSINLSTFTQGTSSQNDITADELSIKDRVVVVKGIIHTRETNIPIKCKVIFQRIEDGKSVGEVVSDDQTGAFSIALPPDQEYTYFIQDDQLLSESNRLSTKYLKKDTVVLNTIYADVLKEETILKFSYITFLQNTETLTSDSFVDLQRIIQMMSMHPHMKIELSGHTDAIGDADYNMDLSRRRAQTVADYLIQHNIDASRIEVTYFGETKPIDTSGTEEGNALNRRVELKILAL